MNHPQEAAEFLKDAANAKWHDDTLWFVRDKRDKVSKSVPEWEKTPKPCIRYKGQCAGQSGNLPGGI